MRIRTVIFDDNPGIRMGLWGVCDRRGHEVFTFPDPGICPLHVMRRCPCPAGTVCADIIISDIDMPQVNGLDFIEELHTKNCVAPHFLLISGEWSDADHARAVRLGCRLFTKPIHMEELNAWLEKIEPMVSPARKLLDWQSQEWAANV